MKNIILLILVTVLAIALTAVCVYLLWFEFHDFEWGYGFWEVLGSIVVFVFTIICNFNLVAYVLCFAAWRGVVYMSKEVFGTKKTNTFQTYTGVDEYHSNSVKNDIDDAISASYNKDYSYEDFAD